MAYLVPGSFRYDVYSERVSATSKPLSELIKCQTSSGIIGHTLPEPAGFEIWLNLGVGNRHLPSY